MEKYWMVVHAKFDTPAEVYDEDGGEVADVHTHYFQKFGVTADSSGEALTIVNAFLRENKAAFERVEELVEGVDLKSLSKEIRSRCSDVCEKGIWYKSGRGLYQV